MKNGLAGRFYVCQVSPARVLQVVHKTKKKILKFLSPILPVSYKPFPALQTRIPVLAHPQLSLFSNQRKDLLFMNRKERRAAAHQQRKAARRAGFPAPTTTEAAMPSVILEGIPEPGLPFPSLSSISPAQLAANRANAQLSTGPTTVEGRTVSSQNRTTHGLARHNGAFQLLATEDPAGFEALN